MEELPEPLVGPDVDVRDLDGFFLNVERMLASELWALASPEEFKAAFSLWLRAWKQKPGGSLPDDDKILAAFSGAGARWKKVKPMAMRGMVKCSDGRWYHKVLCEDVLRAYQKKLERHDRVKAATEARKKQRDDERNVQRNDPAKGQRNEVPGTGQDRTGQDRTGLSPLTPLSPPSQDTSPPNPEESTHETGMVSEIIQAWNQESGCLPITLLTPLQTANLLALTRAAPEQGELDWWRTLFRRIKAEMLHLQGDNNRGWRADLGWVTDKENWPNVINGRYCNGGKHAPLPSGAKPGTHAHRVNHAQHDLSAQKLGEF